MKKLWVLLLSACIGLGTLIAQDINTLMEQAQKGNAKAQYHLGVLYSIGTTLGAKVMAVTSSSWQL